jgi:hypothetical protein
VSRSPSPDRIRAGLRWLEVAGVLSLVSAQLGWSVLTSLELVAEMVEKAMPHRGWHWTTVVNLVGTILVCAWFLARRGRGRALDPHGCGAR